MGPLLKKKPKPPVIFFFVFGEIPGTRDKKPPFLNFPKGGPRWGGFWGALFFGGGAILWPKGQSRGKKKTL